MASFWYASSVKKQPVHRETQSEQTAHMQPVRCAATPRLHPPTGPAWGACFCCCWGGGIWLQRSFIMRKSSCGQLIGLAAVSRVEQGPELLLSYTQLFSVCIHALPPPRCPQLIYLKWTPPSQTGNQMPPPNHSCHTQTHTLCLTSQETDTFKPTQICRNTYFIFPAK